MPAENPTVSIVVPNYNYASALAHCLRAATAQSYQPTEVIVVDDNSTDDSVAVAHSFGVRVLHTPRNSGVSTARNIGAREAIGDILFFVDSDVALAPDAVANAVAALSANPQAGAVCGVYEPTPMVPSTRIKEYRTLHHSFWMTASAGPIETLHTAMCAMPAAVFAEIGPFNERLRHSEDGEYGSRICAQYQVLSCPDVHGRHDHDATIGIVLSKVFHRTRLHIPLFVGQRGLRGEYATGSRAAGSMATVLALLTVALTALSPLWAAVPVVLIGLAIASDLDIYRYVLRIKGMRFLGYFALVQLAVNLFIAAGALAGLIQWITRTSFRHIYDTPVREPAQAGNDQFTGAA